MPTPDSLKFWFIFNFDACIRFGAGRARCDCFRASLQLVCFAFLAASFAGHVKLIPGRGVFHARFRVQSLLFGVKGFGFRVTCLSLKRWSHENFSMSL